MATTMSANRHITGNCREVVTGEYGSRHCHCTLEASDLPEGTRNACQVCEPERVGPVVRQEPNVRVEYAVEVNGEIIGFPVHIDGVESWAALTFESKTDAESYAAEFAELGESHDEIVVRQRHVHLNPWMTAR